MSKVANHSEGIVELATMQKCPRCKGFGGIASCDHGKSCDICDGDGEVWRSVSGWARPKYARIESSKLY